jgi:hypothetical protein
MACLPSTNPRQGMFRCRPLAKSIYLSGLWTRGGGPRWGPSQRGPGTRVERRAGLPHGSGVSAVGQRPRRLDDQVGDRSRLADVDGVPAGCFGRGRAGPLGHRPLRRRRDHPVLGCDQIPGRLAPPRGVADRAVERVDAPRHLRPSSTARLAAPSSRRLWLAGSLSSAAPHRSDRHGDRPAPPRALPGRVELEGDVLVRAGLQCRPVPGPAVGLLGRDSRHAS